MGGLRKFLVVSQKKKDNRKLKEIPGFRKEFVDKNILLELTKIEQVYQNFMVLFQNLLINYFSDIIQFVTPFFVSFSSY